MKNLKSSLVLSLGLLFINPYAVVAEENSKSQNQSESVDGKGTKFTREGSTEKITDSSGTVRTVSEDASTKDPKGVMNKTTETKHTYSEVKANGESFKNENSVNAAGTSTDYSAEVKVDKNAKQEKPKPEKPVEKPTGFPALGPADDGLGRCGRQPGKRGSRRAAGPATDAGDHRRRRHALCALCRPLPPRLRANGKTCSRHRGSVSRLRRGNG